MKRKLLLLLLTIASTQFSFAQLSPVITSWIINTTGATGYGGIESNVQVVQYTDSNVYVSSTCIPGYDIGPWKNNPNIPSNQNFVFKITRFPKQNTDTPVNVGLGHIGVWTNGVSIFNPEDAMSYNNQNIWHQNADYFEGAGFDSCLGHPNQTGEYHHHINPRCLYNDADSTHHSPIIGWSFDGYPIYGAYGYSNPNSAGAVKRMRSSYQLRHITTRDTMPDGTVLTSGQYGPAIGGNYPLGAYIEDYAFVPNSGDLDFHNGRFCVTPDYPNGTYAYFVTIDSALNAVFPYVLGLNYYGVIPGGNTGPGSGHNTIADSTTIYNPSAGITQVNTGIKFQFLPNPVTDYAYIYFDPTDKNNITGKIYDVKGRLVQTIKNLQPSISYALNLSTYQNGIYFLHLTSGTTDVVQKIVKIK